MWSAGLVGVPDKVLFLDGGVNVDEDDHQQVQHGPNDTQHGQNPLLPVVLRLLRDGLARVVMAMGEHV